jgi:hypothetical protein
MGRGGKVGGQALEAVRSPCDEDQLVPANGELAGELLTNSRRSAGD